MSSSSAAFAPDCTIPPITDAQSEEEEEEEEEEEHQSIVEEDEDDDCCWSLLIDDSSDEDDDDHCSFGAGSNHPSTAAAVAVADGVDDDSAGERGSDCTVHSPTLPPYSVLYSSQTDDLVSHVRSID